MAIGAQLGGAAVGMHGFDRALDPAVVAVNHPVFSELDIDQVTLFQIDNLIRHARQRHRVAGEKVFELVLAQAQNQR